MDNPILALARSIQDKLPAVLATVVEDRGASLVRSGVQMCQPWPGSL
jgi:hypothetical protein